MRAHLLLILIVVLAVVLFLLVLDVKHLALEVRLHLYARVAVLFVLLVFGGLLLALFWLRTHTHAHTRARMHSQKGQKPEDDD